MNRVPDHLSLVSVPIPLARGVHWYVEQPSGETVFLAITSTGALLNGELRRKMPDETAAMVRDEMWKDLDRQDHVSGPPQLSVYVDGKLRSRDPSRPE